MVDQGRVPGVYRVGRLVRFRADAIDAWIAAGCKGR
jgi:excisionase family DNA binding protein